MAVSMRLLLILALLLLWFRFFDSHVKAYIYVIYLDILSIWKYLCLRLGLWDHYLGLGWSCVQTSEAIDRSQYHRHIESELIKLSTRI